jgi:hypothetical protein
MSARSVDAFKMRQTKSLLVNKLNVNSNQPGLTQLLLRFSEYRTSTWAPVSTYATSKAPISAAHSPNPWYMISRAFCDHEGKFGMYKALNKRIEKLRRLGEQRGIGRQYTVFASPFFVMYPSLDRLYSVMGSIFFGHEKGLEIGRGYLLVGYFICKLAP